MKKYSICFILLSSLLAVNVHAIDEVVVTAPPWSSGTYGGGGAGSNGQSTTDIIRQQQATDARVADIKTKLRAECKAAAETEKLDCEKEERADFTWNVNICNSMFGVPGALLTGGAIMDSLKKTGKVGKVAAVLGSGLVYGAVACKDWAAANRDADIAQCAVDLDKEMNEHCNKI